VQALLGPDWKADANRQRALENSRPKSRRNPTMPCLVQPGSNLVYFESMPIRPRLMIRRGRSGYRSVSCVTSSAHSSLISTRAGRMT